MPRAKTVKRRSKKAVPAPAPRRERVSPPRRPQDAALARKAAARTEAAARRKTGAARFPMKVAAIDVGSAAIRFLVAEFVAPGRFVPLVSERLPIRLGHGVFLSGRLLPDSMDAAVEAFKGFRAAMKRLGVTRYRGLATSAVRESRNGDEFLARVRKQAGITLETITGSEEARLFYLAVKNRVPLGPEGALLVDLGGGSVEVALVDDRGIRWIESHTMGSVRLLEELAGAGEEPGRFSRLMAEYVATLRLPSFTAGKRPAAFIATGGNIEALAKLAGAPSRLDGVAVLPLAGMRRTIATLSRLSYRQRIEQLGLREDRADIILPAALLYERLASLADAHEILVPFVGIKEGIVLDLVDDLTTHRAHEDRAMQLAYEGAVALGRRYMFDEGHATHVARLAGSIFDQLAERHGLTADERRILVAAAVLHDIGSFVSTKRHHKHTLYLVSASELPGFSPAEIQLVANVARYHRKTEPAAHHEAYIRLAPADRERVRRLAAILRVADAMDREHRQKVRSVRIVEKKRNQLAIRLEGDGDLLLENWALKRKAPLFAKAFKAKLTFRGATEN
jgi:exopolyphosphatase/guanosine-5'-triphosphate,3'-diphosphate pyrophosphatase